MKVNKFISKEIEGDTIYEFPEGKGLIVYRGECVQSPKRAGYKVGNELSNNLRNQPFTTNKKVAEEFACMGKERWKYCDSFIIHVVANKIKTSSDYRWFEQEVAVIGKNKVKEIEKVKCR